MVRGKKLAVLAILVTGIVTLIAGCGASSKIVGKWIEVGSEEYIYEFTGDGKIKSDVHGDMMEIGTYTLTDDALHTETLVVEFDAKVVFQGNTMTWTGAQDGQVVNFIKAD